ncbi:MAG: ABC transporter substrate-binding protein [Butyricicoccus sp.]
MKRITAWCLSAALLLGGLSGCGTARQSTAQTQAAVSWSDMQPTDSVDLEYAECFSVDHYDGGYSLITVKDDARYLVVPENASVPDGLDADIVVLQQPLDSIYLVSSSVMDQFVALDALDNIALSGTKQDGWYIDEAKQAMADGKITYAGKYSAPDYETIYSADCNLAIENTMIYHTPEVKEQLEKLGIPVFVERSSYEPHALGRMEWIKVYGTLLGCEDKAEKLFADKVDGIVDILQKPAAGKTVSFFYITSNGAANVRKSTDYIAEMISLAGGKYIFDDLTDDTAKSTVNMQMESFYAGAKDADVMIYNATSTVSCRRLTSCWKKPAACGLQGRENRQCVVYGEEPVPVHNGAGRADPRLPYRHCRRRPIHPEILTQTVLKGEDFP